MNVGSLFSGIGGIEIGFEAAGFKTEWFVECEPYAQAVLRKQFPSATIYGDVKTIDWGTVPKVDILTGGFPCQDISNAGKRAGIKGSRSSLWKHYLEAIRTIRPKFAVIENVSALTDRGLNVVLANLAQIGYDAEWYNISASSVGALHRRERLFVFAYPNSSGLLYGQTQEQPTETRKQTFSQSISSNDIISNSKCERLQGHDKQQTEYTGTSIRQNKSRNVGNSNCERLERFNEWQTPAKQTETFRTNIRTTNINEGCGYWAIEPKLGRVANGISNRIHRIKCLGNAVVPQVAEVIAKAIKEHTDFKAYTKVIINEQGNRRDNLVYIKVVYCSVHCSRLPRCSKQR